VIAVLVVLGVGATAIGFAVGSFCNVLIYRLPEDRSLWPRSACPRCGTQLRAAELVPILSYVWLRGRCAHCGAAIPRTYPLVEALGGLLGFLAFRRIFTGPEDVDVAHGLAWILFFGFLAALVVASYVDLRHRIIPDQVTVWAVPVGVVGAVVLELLGYDGWMAVGWRQSLLGIVLGGGFLAVVALVGMFVFRRDAMGWGDVKMMTMIGAFLGVIPGAWLVLLSGSLLGLIVSLIHLAVTKRRQFLPFGPSLSLSAAVYFLYGDVLVTAWFPAMARWI
jgi:leader peptidase (prepilin peptidase)/N-methyltransferase